MTYTIKGLETKETKLTESVKAFITEQFSVKGSRIGYANFVKKFSVWNDENGTVKASSLDLHKVIFNACFKLAKENKKSGLDYMPIFTSDKDNKVSVVSVVSMSEYDKYYSDIKDYKAKKAVDPTTFVLSYIAKHENEIDFKLLKESLADF